MPQWAGEIGAIPHLLRAEALIECGVRSIFAFPVLVDDEAEAIIECFSPSTSVATYELLSIMQEVGRLMGRVIERFELQQAIAESVESEQRRNAEELHDGLGQELTAVSLMAKSLYRTLEGQQSPTAEKAKDLAEAIPRIVRQTRAVVRGLMPVEVDGAGLMSALEQLTEATQEHQGVRCRLEAPQPVRVEDGAVAHHLVRIAQEAVNNAVKHAGASQIVVRLTQQDEGLQLEVEDDGKGIMQRNSGEPLSRGMGLRIMKHRANLIRGALSVDSGLQGGTRVACRLEPEEVTA